jgi:hypothetical protein
LRVRWMIHRIVSSLQKHSCMRAFLRIADRKNRTGKSACATCFSCRGTALPCPAAAIGICPSF